MQHSILSNTIMSQDAPSSPVQSTPTSLWAFPTEFPRPPERRDIQLLGITLHEASDICMPMLSPMACPSSEWEEEFESTPVLRPRLSSISFESEQHKYALSTLAVSSTGYPSSYPLYYPSSDTSCPSAVALDDQSLSTVDSSVEESFSDLYLTPSVSTEHLSSGLANAAADASRVAIPLPSMIDENKCGWLQPRPMRPDVQTGERAFLPLMPMNF